MSFAQVQQPSAAGSAGSAAATGTFATAGSVGGGAGTTSTTLYRATVKQALSGDAVIIRGQPKGGPPPEKQLNLSNIIAPKLARRPTDPAAAESKDEPFAWEAREFLRQKVVGKEIVFAVDYKVGSTGREYGMIYLGKDASSENVAESLVAEGLVEVRQVTSNRPQDEYLQRLNALQESAKSSGKGKWGTPDVLQQHVRDVKWSLPTNETPRNFVDSLRREPVKAVIEHVRDGSSVRAFLLPSFHYVTVMVSGIKCPGFKVGEDGRASTQDSEPYAEEAKYFTEVRLLQRDVEVILESVSNQNFLGTILHPNGNIAEALLKEGFAKCVDWSMAVLVSGAEKYRAAEKIAKEKRLRLWKSYQPPASQGDHSSTSNTFTAKVIEVVMGDALVVKTDKGAYQKIWLSSIRQPRAEDAGGKDAEQKTPGRQFRPLYDIPFMFEAREFLRKRLIGKKVQVTVDYVQASNQQFPERSCCTVLTGGQNVAEALVSKGLATVVRYRQGDENRSSHYDELLAAEEKAKKTWKGLHSLKRDAMDGNAPVSKDMITVVRVQELQGDAAKSKQFFPFLQRAGRSTAIVEFVASGSRFRVYVPKETCLLTFLLSGISCPRAGRATALGAAPQTQQFDAQPFGDEALKFVKEMCLQHEVEIEVETLDKAGSFVGYMFVGDPSAGGSQKNLSVELVEQGLATVHFTAERSRHYGALKAAQDRASAAKVGLWSLPEYQQRHEDEDENEANESGNYENGNVGSSADEKEKTGKDGGGSPAASAERKPNYRKAMITEVLPDLRFYAQFVEQGPKLEQMMTDLRLEMKNQPPIVGAYNPKRNDICAARFSADKQWYRAKVEMVKSRDHVEILYIDFGNRETTSASELAQLPASYHPSNLPAGAREFRVALVRLHPDADYAQLAVDQFNSEFWLNGEQQEVLLNVEYTTGGIQHVTVCRPAEAPSGAAAGSSSGSTSTNIEPVAGGSSSSTLDLGKRLISNGLGVVEKRRPGNDRRLVSLMNQYAEAEEAAKKARLNIWQYGDFTGDEI